MLAAFEVVLWVMGVGDCNCVVFGWNESETQFVVHDDVWIMFSVVIVRLKVLLCKSVA